MFRCITSRACLTARAPLPWFPCPLKNRSTYVHQTQRERVLAYLTRLYTIDIYSGSIKLCEVVVKQLVHVGCQCVCHARCCWRAGASQPSRPFERNFLFLYIYIYAAVVVCHVSAHARLLTRFFLSEIISTIFTHFHTRSICADRSSQPAENLHSTSCAATFGD